MIIRAGRWCADCGAEIELRRRCDPARDVIVTVYHCWSCHAETAPALVERARGLEGGTMETKPQGVVKAEQTLEEHHGLPTGSLDDVLRLLALYNALKAAAAAVHDQAIGATVDVPVVRGLHLAGRLYDAGPVPLVRRG